MRKDPVTHLRPRSTSAHCEVSTNDVGSTLTRISTILGVAEQRPKSKWELASLTGVLGVPLDSPGYLSPSIEAIAEAE